ncbi:MAG: PTS sugar transporter subunit IIA [Erysipelotrichaceae bacterium]
MKGILLLSHGNMAKGMLQSSSVFFGEELQQVAALDFQITDDADLFEQKIGEAIVSVDSGEGVVVLTDLFAGTPAHKTTGYVSEGVVDVICGMNLPLFLELLNARENEAVDINELIDVAKKSICQWKIAKKIQESDDDFF